MDFNHVLKRMTDIKNLLFTGQSDNGIKLNGNDGFADLRGHFTVDTSGSSAPLIAVFDVGDQMYGYNQGDLSRWSFHVEHSDKASGVKYLHLHIVKALNATVTAGTNLVITAVIKHRYHYFSSMVTPRGISPAPITLVFTITPAELNTIPNGGTGLFELEAFNEGGTGGKLNSLQWFIDDDINVTFTFTTVPTITGGLGGNARLGLPHVDFHRGVTGIQGTVNKDDVNGSFYAA
jgi:hypothetical protein